MWVLRLAHTDRDLSAGERAHGHEVLASLGAQDVLGVEEDELGRLQVLWLVSPHGQSPVTQLPSDLDSELNVCAAAVPYPVLLGLGHISPIDQRGILQSII